MVAFVLESLLICTAACLFGLLGSFNLVHWTGHGQDYLSNVTYTVLAYDLKVTPGTVGAAIGLAMLVGIIGALAPALRAARTQVIEALRKA